MKTWKKLSALLLSLLLLCGLTVPAFALEASKETLALYQAVESFRMDFESDIEMSMNVMGESMDMDIDIEGKTDYIVDPEHARMTLNIDMMDTEQESLVYYEKVEDGYRMIVSSDEGETWTEQLVDAGDLPSGASLPIELLAKLTDLREVLPETGNGKIKGTAVTVYSGALTGKDASDILASSGTLSMLENSFDMDLGELNTDDLGSLPVSIAVDNKTGYLMQYDLDITEMEQNLMNRMMRSLLSSELEGEDLPEDLDLSEYLSVEVGRAVTSTILYDYNQVEEFNMPEVEASAAPQGGEDGVPFAVAQGFRFLEEDDDIAVPTEFILADGLSCSNNGGNLFIESVELSEPEVDAYVSLTIRYNKWGVDTITGPKGFEEHFGEYDNGYGSPYAISVNDVTFVDYYTGRILSPAYGWNTEISQDTEVRYDGNFWIVELEESAEDSSYNSWYRGANATAWLMQWQFDYKTVVWFPEDYDGLLLGMNTKELVEETGEIWEGNPEDWVFIRLSDLLG